ncbi:MAG TPA: hypothetical protein VF266_19910 [Thermoanaerobaculia bacterium]
MLERLQAERRISAIDIERYLREMKDEISTLEERLRRYRDAVGSVAAGAAAGIAAGAAAVTAATVGRRRGRKPGRPAGTPGRKPGRPAGSGRGPGRPPKNAAAAGSSGAAAGSTSAATASPAKRGGKRGRKGGANITPEQLASRQLQGRYLALVRGFPESRRTYFAKVAKEKGREAAIKEMQDSKK